MENYLLTLNSTGIKYRLKYQRNIVELRFPHLKNSDLSHKVVVLI